MGKIGKNSLDIQESNRLSILRILAGEDVLTRAELSRRTGLKQATITNIINDFLASGVVSETGALKGNLGRRSIGIRINAEKFNVVAIKIARRSYSVGIFNIKNQLLEKEYQKLDPAAGASAARLDWGRYRAASRQLDLLVVTMVAMELEASRLQVLNAKLKFFPSVDINFYSPTLFSSTGGTYGGFFAGAGDMKVNMSLREELDTRLTSWFQYKSAKESHELLQREVVMELQRRRIKIAALLESRRRFELWQGVLMKEIAFKESRLSVSGDEYLEQRKDIRKMYADLDNEASKNAEVEAALIMEYGWLK